MLFTSADLPNDQRFSQYQSLCMARLIGAEPVGPVPTFLELLTPCHTTPLFFIEEQATDVCQWTGVICANGSVKEIHWNRNADNPRTVYPFSMDLQWFPPTSTKIIISDQDRNDDKPFSATYLPRDIQHFEMRQSRLSGRLDTWGFPRNLTHLIVAENLLYGRLDVRDLPKNSFTSMPRIILFGRLSLITASFPTVSNASGWGPENRQKDLLLYGKCRGGELTREFSSFEQEYKIEMEKNIIQ